MIIVLYYAKRFSFGQMYFLRDCEMKPHWLIENVSLRITVLFDACTVVFCLLFLTDWSVMSCSSVTSQLFLTSELTV